MVCMVKLVRYVWYVYQSKACMVCMVCMVGLVGFGMYGAVIMVVRTRGVGGVMVQTVVRSYTGSSQVRYRSMCVVNPWYAGKIC